MGIVDDIRNKLGTIADTLGDSDIKSASDLKIEHFLKTDMFLLDDFMKIKGPSLPSGKLNDLTRLTDEFIAIYEPHTFAEMKNDVIDKLRDKSMEMLKVVM
jgi:hypothetical protein